MGDEGTSDRTLPVFAHQIRAIRARQSQDDREAVGAHLRRGGFHDQAATDKRARKKPTYGRAVDFFTASPLTGRDRQSGGFRIPHVDFKSITPTFTPTSKDGKRRGEKARGMTAVQHFDYVANGAKIEIGAHIDYISRITGVADPLDQLAVDALDEQEERNEKNALGLYTNIPGGRARARSLFDAAERAVPAPKTYELLVSTADWDTFAYMRRLATTPDWIRPVEERLRAEHEAAAEHAVKNGKAIRHRLVVVDRVSPAEAFDRLAQCDDHHALRGKIDWKQGRTERCQYRFVGELPDGLSSQERYAILSGFCKQLSEDGWMVFGAIHQPDATNNKRNFHVHIDLYDRKAGWLEDERCWDFEHVVRRNGKLTHPLRHNKVRYGAQPPDGKSRKFNVAGFMRARFIDTVNAVVGDRLDVARYLHGTYSENGIDLTPLDHMGNRRIGLEKRGIITEVGSHNARRLAADDAAACEKRATKAEAALIKEVALLSAVVPHESHALAAARRYERLQRRIIRRRLQAELAGVVVAMARSRADAVIRTLTPAPGHRVRFRPGDAELLADATRHIEWVERTGPSPRERDRERRTLAKLEWQAELEMRVVEAAICRPTTNQSHRIIAYRPHGRAKALSTIAVPSPFDDFKRARLIAWLKKHIADSSKLVFDRDEVLLDKSVPMSIDTMMRQFGSEPVIQSKLRAERHRREMVLPPEPAQTLAAPLPKVSPIVRTTPADEREFPKRAHRAVAQAAPRSVADGEDTAPFPALPFVAKKALGADVGKEADRPVVATPDIAHSVTPDANDRRVFVPASVRSREKRLDANPTAQKLKEALLERALTGLARKPEAIRQNLEGQYVVDFDGMRRVDCQVLEKRLAEPIVQDALADMVARGAANSAVSSSPPPPGITEQPDKPRTCEEHKRGLRHQTLNNGHPLGRGGLQPALEPAGFGVLDPVDVVAGRSTDDTNLLLGAERANVQRQSRVRLRAGGQLPERRVDKPILREALGNAQLTDPPAPTPKPTIFDLAQSLSDGKTGPLIRAKGGIRDEDGAWPLREPKGQGR